MQQEGFLRCHRRKFGRYEDLIVCGVTKAEWQHLTRARSARDSAATQDGKSSEAPPAASSP